MTYNVHQLLHLARSVIQWGPLWCHSGYIFESANGKIKRQIHALVGIPQQILRIFNWNFATYLIKQSSTLTNDVANFIQSIEHNKHMSSYVEAQQIRFLGKGRTSCRRDFIIYKKLLKDGRIYNIASDVDRKSIFDGSYVLLNNQSYGRLLKFYINNTTADSYAEVKVLKCSNFVTYSNKTFQKQILKEEKIIYISPHEIKAQCICLTINNIQYITAISHVRLSS